MVTTTQLNPVQDGLVHSYLFLRRAIGCIGLCLPVALIVGNLVVGDGLRDSISGYYYSDVRNVLVGAMCAVGVFLFSYRGYGWVDDLVSDLAAVAAIGVAVFPAAPANPVGDDKVYGVLHLVSAAVFFLSLSYFSLVLFRRNEGEYTPEKAARNRLYLTCGVVMLACLAALVVCNWPMASVTAGWRPALWLETTAILAFGISWLTKGEAILGDSR
ncbi:hypothetical protein [Actinokineospora inagensis]|uniref:hypothetical protein n=1 Tax=Actinokineospora inagensis TaxID=103730 RepID=UPI00040E8A12|nr:hypothetical protein [Actinokineospora inagensis]